jgi:hypothetical protein
MDKCDICGRKTTHLKTFAKSRSDKEVKVCCKKRCVGDCKRKGYRPVTEKS